MSPVRCAAATLVVVLLAVTATVTAPPAAAAAAASVHHAPVTAPVVEPFRAPLTPYGPQHLGLRYGTDAGVVVHPSAAGLVVFAGRTPQGPWVTVTHADGLRTSYGPLATVAVRVGQVVGPATPLGATAGALHFSVRLGDLYLDPALVLSGAVPVIHLRLVPAPLRPGIGDEQTRQHWDAMGEGITSRAIGAGMSVVSSGGRVIGVVVTGAAEAALRRAALWQEDLAAIRAVLSTMGGVVDPESLGRMVHRWWDQRDECTPPGTELPPPGPDRAGHLVVLVAGLGSTSTPGTSIEDVDVRALGYDPARVARFSYAGGLVPAAGDRGAFAGIAVHPYTGADSQAGIDLAADRLRVVLAELARLHPGVPVDVIAHSLGGVVAVRAVQERGGGGPPLPGDLSIITIASPHAGSTLSTAGGIIDRSPARTGEAGLDVADELGPFDHDHGSVRELRQGSAFLRDYHARGWPPTIDVTSIGGRSDGTVTSSDTRLAGATEVVVDSGFDPTAAHSGLPGMRAAGREVALALAGLDPTCRSLLASLEDHGADWAVSRFWLEAGVALSVLP